MILLGLAAGLALVPMATIDGRTASVGDLVRTPEGRRPTGADAALVVLRLPAGRASVTLPASAVAALVRRRVPALGLVAHDGDGARVVTIKTRHVAVPVARQCWATVRAMAAGRALKTEDVVPAPCGGSAARVGHDDLGSPILLEDAAAGAALGRLGPLTPGRVAAGTPLALRASQGPVVIERAVVTLQEGRSGRSVFVKDGDGRVFSAPLAIERNGS